MHKCVNNSIGNIYHLEQWVDNFFPYSQKQLGFDKPLTIVFQSDDDNSSKMLGKTAHYDPENMEVVLYVDNRHPKDVMRSLSHELVHHAQNCRGDFSGQHATEAGYAQRDPHLRKMEREAYTKGNLIFRDFEDLIKTGKIVIDIDFKKSGEPKMSLKEWKDNELNMLLMKKWGLLQEQKDAPRKGDVADPEVEAPKDPSADIDLEQGKKLNEDTEGEETYHYGEDEGADRKKEGRLEAHLDAIEHHLHKLRGDMAYDEDHERRHEKGTDFREGMSYRDDEDEKSLKKESEDDPEDYTGERGAEQEDIKDLKTKGIGESISRKISVREAKEITQRIIQKIRKEGV